ncbi:ceramide-1-phosphate transfer protein-like [Paramacrobiotus metropolitanus]|uniref:ceramide-1-phosphate transfer protein-like n=1 Tax=Paramacrobiotus metropolitanus TaxID=2943436 RepID=UPI00244609B8|nr:ceramide-1-phosphate transfer protein-like [Paramacrobiotus metropolitanus]
MALVNYIPREDGIDNQLIADSFDAALEKDAGVEITSYIEAFQELARFFEMMGVLFATMAADIREQIRILERYLQSGEREHYTTIERLVAFEAADDRRLEPQRRAKDPSQSGSRTVLHLNRMLDFFIRFLGQLENIGDDDKMSTVCQPVYKASLGKYHSWLLSAAAGFAISTLPTKVQLCEKTSKYNYEDTIRITRSAGEAMQRVYEVTDKIFTEHDLHKLPF